MNVSDTNQRNAIVFLIDSLNPLYLAPHGCTWIKTPALDKLAAESVVFERATSESVDFQKSFDSFLSGNHPFQLPANQSGEGVLRECRRSGIECVLFTDDPENCPATLEAFDRVVELSAIPKDSRPGEEQDSAVLMAESISDTHLAHCFARILNELPKQVSPFLFVIQLTSIGRIWDAPFDQRDRFRDDEDPESSVAVFPPNQTGAFDPDEILKVSHAYAAQIEVLDTCLGVLLEEAELDGMLDDTLFLLAGLRGYPLGHQGQIGHHDSHLGSDATRVPLFARLPIRSPGEISAARCHQLTSPAEWFRFVADWLKREDQQPQRLQRIIESGESVSREFTIVLGNQSRAIWTPAWLLIENQEKVSLFVKPDDRWDVNPVQDRCQQIAEDLVNILDAACAQLDNRECKPVGPLADELVFGLE